MSRNSKNRLSLPGAGLRVVDKQNELSSSGLGTKNLGSDDFILSGLVEGGFITGSLKTVFERNKQDDFLITLKTFKEKKNEEIKVLCSDHYEEFLQSVSHLKEVTSEAVALRSKIEKVNDAITSAGNVALDRGRRTVTFYTVDNNIQSAITVVEKCQIIASLATKTNKQFEEEKYYPALKTLDQLEENLKNINKYEFTTYFDQYIAIMKEKIKKNVVRQFNDWLVKMKDVHNSRIGILLLEKTQKNKEIESIIMKNLLEDPSCDFTTNYLETTDENIYEILKNQGLDLIKRDPNEAKKYQETKINPYEVPFISVYNCKHVYCKLGIEDEFIKNFKETRWVQVKQKLSQIPKNGKVEEFQEWLCWILGHLAVEHHILNSTKGLISIVELNLIWERIQDELQKVLDEEYKNSKDAMYLLSLKDIVSLFSSSISNHIGLDISFILDLIASFKLKFYDSVLSNVKKEIANLMENERYIPFEVFKEEFLKLVEYNLEEDRQITFPLLVPFTTSIPSICVIITKLISQLFDYGREITDVDDMCKEGITQILFVVNSYYDKVIIGPNPTLSQAAQITINCNYLIKACKYFEKIYQKQSKKKIEGNEFLNSPKKLLKEMILKSEETIINIMYYKIKEALKLSSSINWNPKISSNTIHPFIQDIIILLENSAQSNKYLIKEKREMIMFKSFQLISNSLSVLIESDIKKLNYNGLKDLYEDVISFDKLIESYGIESCKQLFVELKKIIEFLLENQVDTKSIETNRKQILQKFQNLYNSQEMTNKVSNILTKLSTGTSYGNTKNLNSNQSGNTQRSFFGNLFNKK
eukprot:gene9940-2261_t